MVSILVLDGKDESEPRAKPSCVTYKWSGHSEGLATKSILKYCENNSNELRSTYLKFIAKLGTTEVRGERIVDRLNLDSGLSLWWMSLLVEQSPFKSSRIRDCIRLLALDKILVETKPEALHLVTDDAELDASVRYLSHSHNVNFSSSYRRSLLSRIKASESTVLFMHTVKGLAYLGYYFSQRWRLRTRRRRWRSESNIIFFLSYFFNLNSDLANQGRYHAHQWEALPEFLHDSGFATNHMELYLKSPMIPGPAQAKTFINKLNGHEKSKSYHTFLDGYLSISLAFQVLVDWMRLSLRRPKWFDWWDVFHVNGTGVSLWALLRHDWNCSYNGKTAVANLIWKGLFKRAMSDLPHQTLGLYLCENQGWERAFIYYWKKSGHGKLVGVAHSTVRYWDLRYFDHWLDESGETNHGLPRPDTLAVNGPAAWSTLETSGLLSGQLSEVEALRYQYLLGPEVLANTERRQSESLPEGVQSEVSMLILGDFTVLQTEKMLQCIEFAKSEYGAQIRLTIKPHPVCRIDLTKYAGLNLQVTREPLSAIAHGFDVAFSSNTTTAGLDLYLMGIPTLVFLDDENLNFSPLRGVNGVEFVFDSRSLAGALCQQAKCKSNNLSEDYFWLDTDLKRWNDLVHREFEFIN